MTTPQDRPPLQQLDVALARNLCCRCGRPPASRLVVVGGCDEV